LVVEDEPAIAELIEVNQAWRFCASAGLRQRWPSKGEMDAALGDAILLDGMLPRPERPESGAQWRTQQERTRAIDHHVDARGDEPDKVAAYAGADDHITKPSSTQETAIHIRAALRRRTPDPADDSVTVGGLPASMPPHRVTWCWQLRLGPTEFKLLDHLMKKNPERVRISRCQPGLDVWATMCSEERSMCIKSSACVINSGCRHPGRKPCAAGYRLIATASGSPPSAAGAMTSLELWPAGRWLAGSGRMVGCP
jgi:DNA-binding response OmpR family regulator